jgi:hypothetical protein
MASFPPQQVSQPAGTRLLLAEQLMLLAFSPGNGRLRVGLSQRPYLEAGLAGAVLTELALLRSVAVEPRRAPARKLRVSVTASPAGDPFLDAMAARVRAEKPRPLGWWISKGLPGLRRVMLDRMVAAGLVTTRRGVLRRHSELAWPQARAEVDARLQRVLLADPARVTAVWAADPRSASLASLAVGCGIFDTRWLPRDQRRVAKATLRALRAQDPIGEAVSDTVQRAKRTQDSFIATHVIPG